MTKISLSRVFVPPMLHFPQYLCNIRRSGARRAARCAAAAGLALLLAGPLGGCASSPKDDPAEAAGRNNQINVWLDKQDADLPALAYHVMPPDEIKVLAPRIKELNNAQCVVRPDGKIDLNLVGQIDVAGMTPAEISERLARLASKYYGKDALDVTVIVTKFESQKLYVFGQVIEPGIKPYTGRDTVLKVLADAKLNALAWPQKVIIVRPNEDRNIRQRVTVDLKTMYENGQTQQDFVLEENDIVFVPPSPLAQFDMTFSKLLFPLRPVGSIALMGMGF